MATAVLKRPPKTRREPVLAAAAGSGGGQQPVLGPESAGILMTPEEFDRAEYEDGYRYELIHGVLIVSPIPLPEEAEPSEVLAFCLRLYQQSSQGNMTLDTTLPERLVKTKRNRRRADRLIWAGLGRYPEDDDTPTIVVEFVSEGKRDRERDYVEKRDEYMECGVKEYWVVDRFERTMTVFVMKGKRIQKQVIQEQQLYSTDVLPGFELHLEALLAAADRCSKAKRSRRDRKRVS